VRCRRCRANIKVKAKGPLPLYCSQACKQRAYERRKYSGLKVALAQDLATVKVRDAIRAEVVSVLRQAGLIEPVPPLLHSSPPKKRPSYLRPVDSDSPDGSS
jgi:hypothetical protein